MSNYHINQQRDVNHLISVIIFVCLLLLLFFGLRNFAHAPRQPQASITIHDTLYQSHDKDGRIIYQNENYWCGVK